MQRLKSAHTVSFTMLAMFVACAAVFLTALDQTVVVTALPQIIADLQIPVVQLDRAAWIVSGYLLGYVIAMPLMGRVSDMYGRRRVFIICLSLFAFGSLLCGLAPILGNSDVGTQLIAPLANVGLDVSSPALIWLVAARFIQAAGGGAIVPIAMAVAGDFYGEKRRGLALGLIGMVTESGGVLGPLYGAIIVQTWGWQAIFYLNLPIVAMLLFLTWHLLLPLPANKIPSTPTHQKGEFQSGTPSPHQGFAPAATRLKERIDLPGALLLGASLVCLSLGLSQEAYYLSPGQGAVNPTTDTAALHNNVWLIAAAVVLLAAFIVIEVFTERSGLSWFRARRESAGNGRRTWPIIELSLFRRPVFSASALTSFLVGAALIIAMADIPIFVATVLERPAIDSGLALLRLTAMIPIGALIGGWLCSRITCRLTAILGLILTAIGFWLMHLWPPHVNWTQITISTLIAGLGFGLVIAPISTTALNAVNSRQIGMASAVVTVLRMVGMILGLAFLTSWGLGRFRLLAAAFKPPAGVPLFSKTYTTLYGQYLVLAAHEVYTAIFLAAGILCLVALVPALFLEGRKSTHSVFWFSGKQRKVHEAKNLIVGDTSSKQSTS